MMNDDTFNGVDDQNLENNDIEIRRSHYEEFVKLMPYSDKLVWAKKKIKEFIRDCEKNSEPEITISFSGGKDSTVLLDLVLRVHAEMKSNIPLVMVYATEVTFPSTIKFVRDTAEKYQKHYPLLRNVQIVNPKKTWNEILTEKGYPIYSKQISTLLNRVKRSMTKNNLTKWFFGIDQNKTSTTRFRLSKQRLFLLDDDMLDKWPKLDEKVDKDMIDYFKKYHDTYFFSEKCCDYIKGNLKHDNRPSFIGTMTEESQLRRKSWIQQGCNIYKKNKKKSRPLSIWNSKDIWRYIKDNNLDVNIAYGFDHNKDLKDQKLRFNRLGCTSCPYGSWIEQKRIEIAKKKIKNNDNSFLTMNRFEILKAEWPNLYLSQIIYNGMYKILIDMDIKIENDLLYMELYKRRREIIDNWYSTKNFRNNIIKVMCQIENFKDYKQKGKKYEWCYTLNEFKQAMKYFNLDKISDDELNSMRKKVASDYKARKL